MSADRSVLLESSANGHHRATGENVNICVLDTEVYSNNRGIASKATNRGAVALFAAAGKRAGKKDLGLIAMSYKNVYVGRIALGANDAQALKVLQEAEALYTTAQVNCKRDNATDLCSRLRRQLDSCRLQLTVLRP